MGHSLLLSTLLGWCWAKLLWNESRQTHWFLCLSSIRVLWFLSFCGLPQLQSCWHFSLPLDFCCRKPYLLRLQNRGLPSRNWPKPSMRRCPRWSLPGPVGFADDSRDFAALNSWRHFVLPPKHEFYLNSHPWNSNEVYKFWRWYLKALFFRPPGYVYMAKICQSQH